MNEQNVLGTGDIANNKTIWSPPSQNLIRTERGGKADSYQWGRGNDADADFQGKGVGGTILALLCPFPIHS